MSEKRKLPIRQEEIEEILASWVSSEEEDVDEDLSEITNSDYEPPSIDTVLDNLQQLSQQDLLDILDIAPTSSNTYLNPNISVTSENVNVENTVDTSQTTSERQSNTYSYSELTSKVRTWKTRIGRRTKFLVPTFSGELKSTKECTNRSTPLDYFNNLFPQDLLILIVENTNKYAQVKRTKFWKNTNIDEIKAFFSIIIMMGINPYSDFELYWSSDPFYNNSEISQVMSCKRFRKLLETIHVCDVSNILPRNDPNCDKLQHIRPMLDILNHSYQENASNSQRQSADESMIKFKGRDSKKQYMPLKPIKRGYKAWCRCDAATGYLYQVDIYQGKDIDGSEEGLGYRVILQLSEKLPRNTLLVFDNFFTSPALLDALYNKGIYAIGTVRMNRKGLPPDLITKKKLTPTEKAIRKENRLDRSELTFRFSHPMSLIIWRDTKDVHVLTTANDPREIVVIERKQKDGSRKEMYCPAAIAQYTRNMGGVDHFDHYRSSYSIGRKSKKSWMRLFWFLFESAVINSYILYKNQNSNRKNIHRDFRLKLARALKANYQTPAKQTIFAYKNKKGGLGVPGEVRLSRKGDHWLEKSTYKRCRYCSTKKNEKRSKYKCTICKVNICSVPCMQKFHSIFVPGELQ